MNDGAIPFFQHDFYDPLVIVLIVLAICSASLSVIGSSTIIFKILRGLAQNRYTTPYDRIIFGISCGDILSSTSCAILPFLNENASLATCQAGGVLASLSLWAIWYNCILSFYFLVTVLSQVQEKNFVRRCEPWLHLSGIYVPIVAIIGYNQGWFRPNDLVTVCEADRVAPFIGIIALSFTFLVMIINYSVIYAVVHKSLASSNIRSVQERIKREATSIMRLYVGCFFVRWLPLIVVFSIKVFRGDSEDFNLFMKILFGISVTLMAILTPLQGLFNVFIYLKPAYTRFRFFNRHKSRFFVLHEALFNSKIPQLYYPSDQPDSHASHEASLGISSIIFESNFFFKRDSTEEGPGLNLAEDAKEEDENLFDSDLEIDARASIRESEGH